MADNPRTLGLVLIVTHILVFVFGVAIVDYANSTDVSQKVEVSEANPQIKIDYMTLTEENEKLNDRITLLENQNNIYMGQITQLAKVLVEKDTEISNLKGEIWALKNDILMLNYRLEHQNKESSEIVNDNPPEATPSSVEANNTYTAFISYLPYSARGSLPYPTVYTIVTPNVVNFSSGLSIEEIVNKIRFNIMYINHITEGRPYLIQYADETLVRGKGDCTDKALLLFSCLLSMGYSANDMGIATISKCDGQELHDIVIIKNPGLDTTRFGKYHFDVDGETFYMVDPTNSLSTSVYDISPQYKDCLIVGNLYFQDTNKGKGWMPYRIE